MFPLGFGPVDLIVAGARSRADSVEEIGGILSGLATDPMHRMNHMAGWVTSAALAMSGGVGSIPCAFVERERGVLPGTISCGHSGRQVMQRIWAGVSARVKGEPLDASEHQPCPGVYWY